MRSLSLVFILVIVSTFIFGQNSFRKEYERANPINETSILNAEERTDVYKNYLTSALRSGAQEKVFLGYLFLLSDEMRHQDYVSANALLIKADSIANLSNNKSWIGHMMQRKAILALRLNEQEEALNWYIKAAKICGEATDSLCMAEAFEQLSYLYGIEEEKELSDEYYKKSIVLFKNHGSEKSLATAYNNFATLNTKRGNNEVAIDLYKKALMIFEKLNLISEVTKVMNNLADVYRVSQQYQKAKELLEQCIKINKKEQLLSSLYINYKNLSATLDSLKDYKTSLYFLELHYELKDSLIGEETQIKIAEQNSKYELKQKEMQILENNLALKEAELRDKIKTLTIIFILFISGLLLVVFYKRIISGTKKLSKSNQVIFNLSKKNNETLTKIEELEKDILKFKTIIHQNQDSTSAPDYNNSFKTILTNEDWMTFKAYFANKHTGYIDALRQAHPSLTEAEERLFLLVKLHLNIKEIASILGIATDSVKKTRSRLKKKLDILDDGTLDDYILKFNGL